MHCHRDKECMHELAELCLLALVQHRQNANTFIEKCLCHFYTAPSLIIAVHCGTLSSQQSAPGQVLFGNLQIITGSEW